MPGKNPRGHRTTKRDIEKVAANAAGVTVVIARAVLDAMMESVTTTVRAGGSVEFRGWGVFRPRRVKGRELLGSVATMFGTDPKHSKTATRYVISFKGSKNLHVSDQ